MKVFTVTLASRICGETYERTFIFSSLEKVNEWKNSYKTWNPDVDEEHAFVREIEVDTNELISKVEDFDIDREELYQ